MKKFSNDTTQYVEKLEAEKKVLLEACRGLLSSVEFDENGDISSKGFAKDKDILFAKYTIQLAEGKQ